MIRLLCTILFSSIIFVDCGKNFRLGRSKGGNLGEPIDVKDENLPPAQWFTQKLDHFRPTDKRTWQQVRFLFLHSLVIFSKYFQYIYIYIY